MNETGTINAGTATGAATGTFATLVARAPAKAKQPPYENVGEAYAHLLLEDRRYMAYDHREPGDRVMYMEPRTMVIRLFDNLEEVGARYSWGVYRENVFMSAAHLRKAFTKARLTEMAARLFDPLGMRWKDIDDLALAIWRWGQANGDYVTNKVLHGGVGGAVEEDKIRVRLDLMKAGLAVEKGAEGYVGLTKQCRQVAEGFVRAEKSAYSDSEIVSFSHDLVIYGGLKTKQAPERITWYYLPVLHELGWVTYRRRETKKKGEG